MSVTMRSRDWIFSAASPFAPPSISSIASTPGLIGMMSYLQPSISAHCLASSRLSELV